MSMNDELRRMLDELGVTKGRLEYSPSKGVSVTAWDLEGGEFPHEKEASFTEFEDGGTLVRIWNITPAQAIAATLGSGTCELINAADDLGKGTSSCMCCSCGYTALDDWWDEFKYCPNCGKRIVEVTE